MGARCFTLHRSLSSSLTPHYYTWWANDKMPPNCPVAFIHLSHQSTLNVYDECCTLTKCTRACLYVCICEFMCCNTLSSLFNDINTKFAGLEFEFFLAITAAFHFMFSSQSLAVIRLPRSICSFLSLSLLFLILSYVAIGSS